MATVPIPCLNLETLAAQGEVIYQDDTPARVLTLMAENPGQAEETPGSARGCIRGT